MPRRFLVGALLALALAGCGQSADQPAPTAVPPTTPDLEAILFKEGDVPGATQVEFGAYQGATAVEEGMPRPEVAASVIWSRGDQPLSSGFARVSVFDEDSIDPALAYFQTRTPAAPQSQAGVGELALRDDTDVGGRTISLIVFQRCNALAEVSVPYAPGDAQVNADTVVAYARRLDERLRPVVCR